MSAVKHDSGKPRYDLISPEALDELAKVLAYGAEKYGDRNWEAGVNTPGFTGKVFAASQRHAWAPRRGEKNDPESGFLHSAHEFCNAMFKLHFDLQAAPPQKHRQQEWIDGR